jgi:hypothetical protein
MLNNIIDLVYYIVFNIYLCLLFIMKPLFTLFLSLVLFFSNCPAQSVKIDSNFVRDFRKALDKNFSVDSLNRMFHDYGGLLTPHSDVTRLLEKLQGKELSVFPLYEFKNEKLYTDNIDNLLRSKNSNQRVLAYLVIASSDDTTKENILLDRIKTEKDQDGIIWSGMALLYLKSIHTTALFDFLVKHEDFGDAHMLPLFLELNKDSLQQTAYSRIHSKDATAKILAAQTLAYTALNPKTEELLKQAVTDWDLQIKGYAIYSVGALQIGNLLETFKPLLDHHETRSIALDALANSPTQADEDYVRGLITKQDTVSRELLDCLYESKRTENLTYWLSLLYTKPTPKKYIFFVNEQPLISTDGLLPQLQTALQKVKDPDILGELVRALQHRTDDTSVDILISLLHNDDTGVRYWAASTAKNNTSPRLQEQKIKDLIQRGLKDTN